MTTAALEHDEGDDEGSPAPGELSGLHYFKKLLPLLRPLHDAGCAATPPATAPSITTSTAA